MIIINGMPEGATIVSGDCSVTVALVALGDTLVFTVTALLFTGITDAEETSATVPEEMAYVAVVDAPLPEPHVMLPSACTLTTQQSTPPAPNEDVSPATTYPPSEVC
jgi:hypothetical protein